MVPTGRPDRRERGAAVADFALVSGLVALVFLGVLQLGFTLHVRNTVISSASEGARVAARAGASPGDGVARTRALLTAALSERFARDVSVREEVVGGVRVVAVTVVAPEPVVGPFGPGTMTLTGRAFDEDQ